MAVGLVSFWAILDLYSLMQLKWYCDSQTWFLTTKASESKGTQLNHYWPAAHHQKRSTHLNEHTHTCIYIYAYNIYIYIFTNTQCIEICLRIAISPFSGWVFRDVPRLWTALRGGAPRGPRRGRCAAAAVGPWRWQPEEMPWDCKMWEFPGETMKNEDLNQVNHEWW